MGRTLPMQSDQLLNLDGQGTQEAPSDDKTKASSAAEPSDHYDPIANLMRKHPGLTREEALEMYEAFGG